MVYTIFYFIANNKSGDVIADDKHHILGVLLLKNEGNNNDMNSVNIKNFPL